MIKKEKLLLIIFCLCLPLFLLLFSYKTTLFLTDLTINQQNAINYLNNKEGLRSDYNNDEVSHLNDVKKVMDCLDYLFYGLLLGLTLIITIYQKEKNKLLKLFKFGGITAVSAMMIILIFSLTLFDQTFTVFHQIFFPQGNWTFPLDSSLIQTFPLEFFIVISRNIFLQSLFWGSIFILLSFYLTHAGTKKS